MNITEIISLAFQSLKGNRLRAALTMLGVVVGIFSIIVIMTIITMLQSSIDSGLSLLNKNTFQIEKIDRLNSRGPGSDRSWRNRKDITIEETNRLKELLKQAKYVGAEQWQFGKLVKYANKETNPNINIAGVTTDAMRTNNWNVDYGRDLRENDINYSTNVCLLGKDIVEKIFPGMDPIGKEVRIDSRPMLVIGVLERQNQLFGQSRDNYAVIPITTFQSMYGRYNSSVNITVTSPSKESYSNLIEAAIGYMRTIRKVEAGEENDFSVFSNETLIGQVTDITSGVRVGAMVVSLIALIAAGIGIMNIMLVSVTERTREIGIRKAIGATKSSILIQFVIEAIVLCLLGGFIGIIFGVGIGNFAGGFLNAQAAVPIDWVLIGLSLCIFVGVIFGTYPAYKAANLDPIEALRYE